MGGEGMANEHQGHRQRMRERYLTGGLDLLQPHEIMELLLYYPIMQKNTNPLAHRLIDTFGSLEGVLTADPEELRKIEGMTPNAVVFCQLLRDVFTRIRLERRSGDALDSYERVRAYFTDYFAMRKNEVLCAAFLAEDLHLMRTCVIAEGDPLTVPVTVRKIVEQAIYAGSSTLILAHNHPAGIARASADDIHSTRRIAEALEVFSMRLVDHVIVGTDGAMSMQESGLLFT